MVRVKDAILIALLLLLSGYLYWEAPQHPTSPLSSKLPLAIAQAIPGLERGGGPNLASQIADFTGGRWRRDEVTLVSGAAVAPDGSNTAVRMAETSGYNWHRIETSVHGVTAGAVHTLSLFVKPAGPTLIQFEVREPGPGRHGIVQFNLLHRAVVYESGDVSAAGMQVLPDGWFRCWTAMPYSGDTAVFNIGLMNRHAAGIYRGSSSTALLIWGVQFEPGDRPRAYAAVPGHGAE